jgi:hypothetical protein
MNKKHHSSDILLNLGIGSLNEMQEVAQDAIRMMLLCLLLLKDVNI